MSCNSIRHIITLTSKQIALARQVSAHCIKQAGGKDRAQNLGISKEISVHGIGAEIANIVDLCILIGKNVDLV